MENDFVEQAVRQAVVSSVDFLAGALHKGYRSIVESELARIGFSCDLRARASRVNNESIEPTRKRVHDAVMAEIKSRKASIAGAEESVVPSGETSPQSDPQPPCLVSPIPLQSNLRYVEASSSPYYRLGYVLSRSAWGLAKFLFKKPGDLDFSVLHIPYVLPSTEYILTAEDCLAEDWSVFDFADLLFAFQSRRRGVSIHGIL